MSFHEIMVLACSLAMDSFAVSLVFGTRGCLLHRRQALMVALIFAVVQGAFITVAWQAGGRIGALIGGVDHWLAFAILAFVSIHMLREGKAKIYMPVSREPDSRGGNGPEFAPECREVMGRLGQISTVSLLPSSLPTLLGLAAATSIDSLGAGVGASLVVGVGWGLTAAVFATTFMFSAAGAFLGRKSRSISRLGGWAYIAGGLILLSIAMDILYKHGVFNI